MAIIEDGVTGSGEVSAAGGTARQRACPVTRFTAIAPGYDVVLCDIWGVLHDGVRAFPAAGRALSAYRQNGGRVLLVSNAPRPAGVVAVLLERLGVAPDAYDRILTSGDLTRTIIGSRPAQTLFHIGPERDLPLFEGLPVHQAGPQDCDYVVCSGLVEDERETVEDYAAVLETLAARGVEMVCANPDIVVERGDRLLYCAGALAAAFERLGGRVIYPGKPHPPIYAAAVRIGAELLGREPDRARILAVGDAIATDVAGARAADLDVLMIARGIHADALGYADGRLDDAKAASWLAAQPVRPTALAPDLD